MASGDQTEILVAIKDAFDSLSDKNGYSAHVGDNDVLWFTRPDGGNFNFTMTEGGTVGSTAITLQANIWPDGMVDLTSGVATSSTTIGSGYNALDFDLVRQGAMLKANSLTVKLKHHNSLVLQKATLESASPCQIYQTKN